MTTLELKKISGTEWNPYFMAYALETGAKNPKEALKRDKNNCAYMIWNNARWNETCERLGIKRDHCSEHMEDFIETICSRIK